MPCVNFSEELVAAFPKAKVVLTQREPEAWVKSIDNSIYYILSWRLWPFLKYIDPVCNPFGLFFFSRPWKCHHELMIVFVLTLYFSRKGWVLFTTVFKLPSQTGPPLLPIPTAKLLLRTCQYTLLAYDHSSHPITSLNFIPVMAGNRYANSLGKMCHPTNHFRSSIKGGMRQTW